MRKYHKLELSKKKRIKGGSFTALYLNKRCESNAFPLITINGKDMEYYLSDVHGDITKLMNTSGEVTRDYQYDGFGNQLPVEEEAATPDNNPFRYCGEYYDAETGSIYLRARYYDTSTGRFLSEDPIKDGVNWYVYAGNNPITFWDPLGLAAWIRDLVNQTTGTIE